MSAPDLRHVFVVTYGRSGSTLLMGILNSSPGWLLRGENRDAVHHLYTFHRTMARESTRERGTPLSATHPFFGIDGFPRKRSLRLLRSLVTETVLRPQADTRVTGFKEIRWNHDDVEQYVAWLGRLFPGARFVVNTRNQADVLRSEWWAEGDQSRKLADVEARLLRLAAALGDAAYHVHYDDYVADQTTLRGLFDWLDEPYDEERVRAVLAVPHSV
jgi:hypothetical protein